MQAILIAVISSGALSALVTGFFNYINNLKNKDDAVQLLLYHDIKMECKEYIKQGWMTPDDMEVLIKMHTTYHNRGGNGFLDKLMDECKKLPIRDNG